MTTESAVVHIGYEQLEAADLSREIETAFGPGGLGILVVRHVPGIGALRGELLHAIWTFATLPENVKDKYVDEASHYNVGWSHGKESMAKGVPDWGKGSYYFNPLHDRLTDDKELIRQWPEFFAPNVWPDTEVPDLQRLAKTLAQKVVEVGRHIARHCDRYVAERSATYKNDRLFQVLSESKMCKARLLHYFPPKEDQKGDWCGWHNDHGSLTGLVPAMYLDPEGKQVDRSVIESQVGGAGLFIRSRDGTDVRVSVPSDCLAFQIGEAAQIHSGGCLEATPHYVKGPLGGSLSRETMAVFMEPEYVEPMDVPEGMSAQDIHRLFSKQRLKDTVPTLASRWDNGISFGNFSKRTFRAYYESLAD